MAGTGATTCTFFGRPRDRFSLSTDLDRLRRDVVFVLEKPSSSLESLGGGFSTGGRRLRRPDTGFFKHFSNFSSVSEIGMGIKFYIVTETRNADHDIAKFFVSFLP